MTVLLAEQDLLLRQTMRSMLGRAGFEVVDVLASTGAWPLLEAGGASAVLVADAGHGSRRTLCGLVHEAKRRWPGLRVVLVSGYGAAPEEVALADRFLPKPFGGKALIQAIRELEGGGPSPARAPRLHPAQGRAA